MLCTPHKRSSILNRSKATQNDVSSCSPEVQEKLSPLAQTKLKRLQSQQYHIQNSHYFLKTYGIACSLFGIEVFALNSLVLNLFFGGILTTPVVVWTEYIIFSYTAVVFGFYLISTVFPNATVNWSTVKPEKERQKETHISPFARMSPSTPSADNSMQDLRWLDYHRFGSPSQTSFTGIMSSSPSSFLKAQRSSDNFDSLVGDDSLTSSVPSPQSKPVDSVYTRKQLDVLLRSNDDSLHETDGGHNSLFSYLSVFDFGRSGDTSTYQLSEDIVDTKKSAYKLKIAPDGSTTVSINGEDNEDELSRMKRIMQQTRASPDKIGGVRRSNSNELRRTGVRRNSRSSPDRQSSSDFFSEVDVFFKSTPLTEDELKEGEYRTRAWLRSTILKPLAEHIADLNVTLEKEHSQPALRIGTSTVDALKLAIIERDSLKSSALPFVLPFLAVHSNQAYLVKRIEELSVTPFMGEYKWNSGGTEPNDQKNTSCVVRRPWNDSLPTDASLVFDLFCVYMDFQLNSSPLVGSYRLDQPFTSRYVVKAPKKPATLQQTPHSFYIHMTFTNPPHFEFVHYDMSATQIKCAIARQSSNLFRAIIHFVHHVKEANSGKVDHMTIGPAGLNLSAIL